MLGLERTHGPGTLDAETPARQAGQAERWRARLLPTSMLTPIRPALQQALDVFGWMDAAGMKLRGREPRGRRLDDEVRPQE